MEPMLMPFGKYQGKPLPDIIAQEPTYINWLLTGADINDNLRAAINNGGYAVNNKEAAMAALGLSDTQKADSYEHNKLQMKFMDPVFCLKAAYLFGMRPLCKIYPSRIRSFEECIKKFYASAAFEESNIDVTLRCLRGSDLDLRVMCIELKPTIHEDYPNILRQINAANQRLQQQRQQGDIIGYLVTDNITTKSATKETLVNYFHRASIRLVETSEIEAVDIDAIEKEELKTLRCRYDNYQEDMDELEKGKEDNAALPDNARLLDNASLLDKVRNLFIHRIKVDQTLTKEEAIALLSGLGVTRLTDLDDEGLSALYSKLLTTEDIL